MNTELLISPAASECLRSRISPGKEVFCRSLFFSARWFVFASCAKKGTHLIILPDRESAEYCCNDLYTLIEGDRVFFLPNSGSGIRKKEHPVPFYQSVEVVTAVFRTFPVGKYDEMGSLPGTIGKDEPTGGEKQ